MKIFFQKSDSLYKIFKTLEKLTPKKTISIHIDPEHSFFDNERRGKQIKEIIEQKKLIVEFITKNERSKYFFQSLGLKVQIQEKSKFLKILNFLYLFIFNIKKFHLHGYSKKNYIFYIVSGFEVAFFLVIFYLIYTLILPSGLIHITPSEQAESIIYNFRYFPNTEINFKNNTKFLSIPTYYGTITYKYELSISTDNIKYLQSPADGSIKIINKTEKKYSFVPKTRFVTDNGIIFQTTSWLEIPEGSEKKPSETIATVKAMEKDENGIFIGSRGNLKAGTKLYVRNLSQSLHLKKIIAEVIQDITGSYLSTKGSISQKDIETLSGKLIEYITKNKKDIVIKNFNIENGILIGFNDIIGFEQKEIKTYNQIGENSSILSGYIISEINFKYIKQEDIIQGFNNYIAQRPSERSKLITIDKNSLIFFDNIKNEGDIMIIPTKIDIIQGYNFKNDVNGILEEIKSNIASKSREEAKKILLSYSEIAGIDIKIRPLRYNTLPKLKSRIKFIFNQ